MKIMHVHAKIEQEIKINNPEVLPEKVALVTTIQHLHTLKEVQKFLEGFGKKVEIAGQVLGCNAIVVRGKEAEAFLYIGSGKFHPIAIQKETNKDVYILKNDVITKLDPEEVKIYDRKQKGAWVSYCAAQNIGVIITSKKGQNRTEDAIKLKELEKDKNVFLFMVETLDFGQMENFPFIDVWVNTACPRVMDDWEKFRKPLINIDTVNKYKEDLQKH